MTQKSVCTELFSVFLSVWHCRRFPHWLCAGQAAGRLIMFVNFKWEKGFGIVVCIDFCIYMATQCEFSRKGHVEINSIQYLLINIQNFLFCDNWYTLCTVFLHLCQMRKGIVSYFSVSRIQCLLLFPPYYSNYSVIFQAIWRYLLVPAILFDLEKFLN